MATKPQTAANRGNAEKSTGPRTPGGKAVSSMNGLRHGLYAGTVILPGESQADFDELRARLIAVYQPDDPVEQNLVHELAIIEWKKRRMELLEASLLTMNEENPACDCIAEYNRISLMQARAGRAWFRLHAELQKSRMARPKPKPAEKPKPQ